jgi:hypothetical protein
VLIRGTVFYSERYIFENGTSMPKLLVLLNTPAKHDNYLLVKTTSQQHDKPLRRGCIKDRSLFSIPPGVSLFEKHTWIQLYTLSEALPDTVRDLKIIGILDHRLTEEILDCLFASQGEDITPHQQKLLRPSMDFHRLKNHFDKRRS